MVIVIILQIHHSNDCLLFFFFSSIFLLFCFCISCERASLSCTVLNYVFPFPGISKMYTDIIRGESMIICGFTSIFFAIFKTGILQMSNFRGKSIIFLYLFIYLFFKFWLSSMACGTSVPWLGIEPMPPAL